MLATLQRALDGVDERSAEVVGTAELVALLAVDQHNLRSRVAPRLGQLGQRDDRLLLLLGQVVIADRWRRRAKNQGSMGHSGQLGRHPAGLVLRRLLLLVGVFVRLVEHDQADFAEWAEQCRTRPDHDDRLFRPQAIQPGFPPLSRRLLRVHHDDALTENLPETARQLRGQADFGCQDDGRFAGRHDLRRQLDVQPRLAAAGYTVQQVSVGLGHRRECRFLLIRQGREDG